MAAISLRFIADATTNKEILQGRMGPQCGSTPAKSAECLEEDENMAKDPRNCGRDHLGRPWSVVLDLQ